MTKRYTVLICLVFSLFTAASAQNTEVGRNSFSSFLYGPASGSSSADTAFSRHAYIYRKEVLGNLIHGDTIRSLEFFKGGSDKYNGNTRFRIYLSMSDTADFGFGNINWSNESQKTGCLLVFEGNLTNIVSGYSEFQRFAFNRSGGKFAFDTTQGDHLKILVEFIQFNVQLANIPWSYENDATVPQFRSSNETKYIIGTGMPTDFTNNSNVRKPYIRINYPRYPYNLNVHNVYALGKVPRRMAVADTIKALVSNDGLGTTYNRKFYLNVSGSNAYTDSVTIDSMVPYKRAVIRFNNYVPSNDGKEILLVIPEKDNYAFGDSGSMERLVNYNVYAHTNPYRPMDGGVGFNSETGDFLAKFYTDTGNYINQIAVEFFSNNLEFQLGIWEADSNGRPGKELFISDTLITKAGQFILPVLPRVKLGQSFFAGIRQLSMNNLAFGFQYETPVRPDVFYFAAPAQSTLWTPFSPGYDFNFNIQPRIQVANDVSVVRASFPTDGQQIELSVTDSIAPRAMLYNFGFQDQGSPFTVVCNIRNQFGQTIYQSSKLVTIDAEDSIEVVFDSTFRLYNNGTNTMTVYTKLPTDLVYDNDTSVTTFNIVISHDVSVDGFFSPLENETFQLNRDSVWPVVRLLNNGIRVKNVTKVNLRVYQGNHMVSDQVRFVDLEPLSSEIIAFDTIVLDVTGEVTFEASVYQSIDSFRSNDTVRIKVNVIKDDDVRILKIIRPEPGSVYLTNAVFKPFIDYRNVGNVSQDSVMLYCRISNSKSQVIYTDSIMQSINFHSTKQALFSDFVVPGKQDTLTAVFRVVNEDDQDPTNDAMTSVFYSAIGNDLIAGKIIDPAPDKVFEAGVNAVKPSAVFINQGYTDVVSSSGFRFYSEIKRLADEDLVYMDSTDYIGTAIGFGDSVTVNWNTPYSMDSTGVYELRVWHNYNTDELRFNDTSRSRFTVARLRSILLTDVFHPQPVSYELNSGPVTPQIRVMNNGLEDIAQFTTGNMVITKNMQVYYEDDFVIGGLQSQEGRIVTYESSFSPAETGTYSVVTWISNPADVNKSDDTVAFTFEVYKRYDVAPVSVVYPSAVDTLIFQRVYKPYATFRNVGDSAIRFPFSVSFQIFEGTSLVYNSNKTINNLAVDESRMVEFDSSFTTWFKGIGTTMVVSRFGFDQFTSNDTFLSTFFVKDNVGISDYLQKTGITVYPNPAQNMLHFQVDNGMNAQVYRISIFNSTGIEKLEGKLESLHASIDISELAAGLYFVRITGSDGRSAVLPVLKE